MSNIDIKKGDRKRFPVCLYEFIYTNIITVETNIMLETSFKKEKRGGGWHSERRTYLSLTIIVKNSAHR